MMAGTTYRMSQDEIGFTEADVINVDHVVDAINELEHECRKLHDKVETETIAASIMRHRLQVFPSEVKKQIQGAVNAARDLNTAELSNLRTSLEKINANIESLESQHTVLEKENAHLHPERSRVRQLHEEVIGHLNKRMSEKASKQIILNETREKLREINQKIEDLEEGILQLKEDLIQERADARMEKKRMKQVVYDTTVKTRELKESNLAKKNELDILHKRVTESEQSLEEIRKNIRQFEISKTRLENQEKLLTKQLQREIEGNLELKQKGIDLEQTIHDEKIAFEEERLQLENLCKELDADIEAQVDKNKGLEERRDKIEAEVAAKMKIRREDEKKVKAQNAILQSAKSDLAYTAEEAARLRGENAGMEERIKELDETHEAILSTMNKQVEELRENLNQERQERLALQAQRDNVQGDLDQFRTETTNYLNSVNKQMKLDKLDHDSLTQEGSLLQKKLRQSDSDIIELERKLASMRNEFDVIRDEHQREVESLEVRSQAMNEELDDKKKAIDEQTPNFERLQKYFDERTVAYDVAKKQLIVMKNKKLSLEDSLKRAKRDLEKMSIPRNKLEHDLKIRREDNLVKMKEGAEEMKQVESEIYSVGCKLKSALEENNTFNEAINKLKSEENDMSTFIGSNEDVVAKLLAQLQRLKDVLMKDWKADNNMERIYNDRDQDVVDDFTALLEKTEYREQVISGITENLKEELGSLAEFLDNLALRRPPASSKMSMRK